MFTTDPAQRDNPTGKNRRGETRAAALQWQTTPPAMLTRLLALLASLALLVVASATTASATTSTIVDAGWQQFTTEGGVGGGSVDGPYLFESTKLTKVTVTDSFCHGDEFSVFDNGVLIGSTSEIPAELRTCPARFYL
jgi:hypothetical protein